MATYKFFVIGDWGESSPAVQILADSMEREAASNGAPSVIVALGDNFYPEGVSSTTDMRWKFDWERVFVSERTPTIRSVPWKAVLGNHDYKGGTYQAQLDFTNAPNNPGGLWQMRGDDATGPPSRQYSFVRQLPSEEGAAGAAREALFIVADTNAAQFAVRKVVPHAVERFQALDVPWLAREIGGRAPEAIPATSLDMERRLRDAVTRTAHDVLPANRPSDAAAASGGKPPPAWKIVFAHHPLFTLGRGHVNEARCLRLPQYPAVKDGTVYDGFSLEPVFAAGDVDAYFTGHEHMMLHTVRPRQDALLAPFPALAAGASGITHHFVCGASCETHWYKGRLTATEELPSEKGTAWVGAERGGDEGFVVVELTPSVMTVRFVRSADNSTAYHIRIPKTTGVHERVDEPSAAAGAQQGREDHHRGGRDHSTKVRRIWEYYSDSKAEWVPYDSDAQRSIDGAYRGRRSTVVIPIELPGRAAFNVTIDLGKMEQQGSAGGSKPPRAVRIREVLEQRETDRDESGSRRPDDHGRDRHRGERDRR